MWGLTPWLRRLGQDFGLGPLIIGVCVLVYLGALAIAPADIELELGLGFLSPGGRGLFALGASGFTPVFQMGRWWTLLSASWIHGGLLHILFNMLWARQLAPAVAHLYGPGRATLIWVWSGVAGFAASSTAPLFPPIVNVVMRPGPWTVGASASLFGLLGALVHFSRRGGAREMGTQVWSWAIALFLFGFVIPNVDNWAHLGGFLGGWMLAKLLDPLQAERLDHLLAGLVSLLLSLAAIVWSLVTAWPYLQAG
jgi:rhomboid protease GluP